MNEITSGKIEGLTRTLRHAMSDSLCAANAAEAVIRRLESGESVKLISEAFYIQGTLLRAAEFLTKWAQRPELHEVQMQKKRERQWIHHCALVPGGVAYKIAKRAHDFRLRMKWARSKMAIELGIGQQKYAHLEMMIRHFEKHTPLNHARNIHMTVIAFQRISTALVGLEIAEKSGVLGEMDEI